MIGVIQKITCSETHPADYFVDRALWMSKLLEDEEANKEKIYLLSQFHTESMKLFEKIRNTWPGNRVRRVFNKTGNPDDIYTFIKMSDEEWSEVLSWPQMIRLDSIRSIFFPAVGWNYHGFKKVNALPAGLQSNDDGLPIFQGSWEIAEQMWNEASL